MKFDVGAFFEDLSRKNQFIILKRITGTLHKDLYTCILIFRLILPRMGNVSDESYRESQNTYFMFINVF
jgi:hypothetical protein